MKTTDIFIRTYPRDYPWLTYLWRSMERYVAGYRRVVIVHPEGTLGPTVPESIPHVLCIEHELLTNDYYGQQLTKLHAHEFTDADVIAYLDSDCVFIEDVDFSTFDPPLVVTPWERVGEAICWLPITRETLGFVSPYETMRGHPFVYPRWLIAEVWRHIGGVDGIKRVMGKIGSIGEFNAIGNYAVVKHPDKFRVLNTETEQLPTRVVHQFWSYYGVDHPKVVEVMKGLGIR